jgi:hypothetical protein
MKKRNNPVGVLALLLVGAAGVYGVGMYIKSTPDAQKVPDAIRRSAPNAHIEIQIPAQHLGDTAVVLTPESHNGEVTFKETSEAVPKGADPIVFAVNRYLENSHIAPSGAKALSEQIKDGTVMIDCSEAMEHTYGSSDEQALLQGLSKTLSQFHGIKKMQFLISGTPIETFGNVLIKDGADLQEVAAPTPNGA